MLATDIHGIAIPILVKPGDVLRMYSQQEATHAWDQAGELIEKAKGLNHD